MRKTISHTALIACCILGFTLSLSIPADAAEEKESVEKRLEVLESVVDGNVIFVSDGRLILFGVEVETVPPTEEERDEREEADGE